MAQDPLARELEDMGDGISGPLDPLAVDPTDTGLRPSREKLVGAAGLLSVALRSNTVTPDDVEGMLTAPPGATTPIRDLMDASLEAHTQDADDVAAEVLRLDMPAEAKMEALRDVFRPVADTNVVNRSAARSAVAAEAYQAEGDLDDEEDWQDVAVDHLDSMPERVEVYNAALGTDEEQQAALEEELLRAYADASDNLGVMDFAEQITPVGSLPTLNAVIDRINTALGEDPEYTRPQTYGRVGSAMRDLRTRYRNSDEAGKREMARIVLAELRGNTGLVQDSNDLVTLAVLDNLFSEIITGKDAYWIETAADTPEEVQALEARFDQVNRELDALTYGPGYPQKKRELMREKNQIRARLEGTTLSQIGDDVFNALDAVGVGSVARTTLSFGTRYLPRAVARMFRAAPETAGRRVADAVERPEVAEQMGMTPANAVELGLPATGKKIEQGVNVLAEMEARRAEAAALLRRQRRSVNLTDAERAKALSDLTDEIGALTEKAMPKAHIQYTSILERPDRSGAAIEAVFGATSQRPYASLRSARNASLAAAEDVFGAGVKPEVVQWNAASQAFEAVPDTMAASTKGEFFLRVQDERSYASVAETWGSLQLGDDAVADLKLGAAGSQWTIGIGALDRTTQAWISTRARQSRAAESLAQGLMKPISDLPFDKKQQLAALVRQFEGQELTRAQLASHGADESVQTAYQAFRDVDNTMYEELDTLLRNEKMRNGFKDVHVEGKRVGFAKPYERLTASGLGDITVFDPVTGTAKAMAKADVAKLYDSGGQIGRLEYPIDSGGQGLRYIMISGKGVRVLPVPMRGVLPRIPGHYPHIFQGKFVVYGVKNGERVALKLAGTEADAAAYVARRSSIMAARKARGKPTSFERVDYELDGSMQEPEAFAKKLDEIIVNRGGTLFGQRSGGRLGNLSKDFGDIQLDPIEALLRGFTIATQSVSKRELSATMRKRLHNFLRREDNRNLFVGSDTPAPRLSMANINAQFSKVEARDTALAYMRQIELVESTPDAWREATRSVYRRMAHAAYKLGQTPFAAKLGLKGAARRTERAALVGAERGSNPVNAFSSLMHGMYIALPAIRQFVLNVAQTSVAASLHPTQFAKSWRQFAGVAPAVYSRIKFLHGSKMVMGEKELEEYSRGVAKAVGMTPEELTQVVNTIVDTGIIDAVSHNTMIREAISDSASKAMQQSASATERSLGSVGRGLEQAQRAAGAPARFLSTIGFQAGENINQIVSFLTLYNADKAKGIANLADSAYVDDLVGRAAELTGNMIAEAAPGYTRSLLKPFFQWLQFSHKMTLLGLPKSVGGSRVFSGVEKARMVFMQYLLFGAEATAVVAVAHQLMEDKIVERLEAEGDSDVSTFVQLWRSDAAKAFTDGLVFDYAANKVAQAVFGEANEEWDDFAWPKTFAPAAGHDALSERIIGMFSLDPQATLGVQMKTASNLWNYGSTVADVTLARWRDMDDASLEQRVEELTKRGGTTLIPPYGKWVANKWALAHDTRLSSGGNFSEGFNNDLEALLATMIGVETKDRLAFYEAREKLEGSWKETRKDRIQEVADTYWQQLVQNSTIYADSGVSDDLYDELLKNYINDQGLLLSVLDRRDKEAVTDIIDAKLQRVASGDGTPAELAFVQRITNKLQQGGFGSEGPKVANYMRHLPFVKDDPRYSIVVEDAWRAVMEEPEPQNMTTNEVSRGE